jgi:hypothetical protein
VVRHWQERVPVVPEESGAQVRRTGRPHRQQDPRSAVFPRYRGGMARSWRAGTPRPIWISDTNEAGAKEAELSKALSPSASGSHGDSGAGVTGATACADPTPTRAPRPPASQVLIAPRMNQPAPKFLIPPGGQFEAGRSVDSSPLVGPEGSDGPGRRQPPGRGSLTSRPRIRHRGHAWGQLLTQRRMLRPERPRIALGLAVPDVRRFVERAAPRSRGVFKLLEKLGDQLRLVILRPV